MEVKSLFEYLYELGRRPSEVGPDNFMGSTYASSFRTSDLYYTEDRAPVWLNVCHTTMSVDSSIDWLPKLSNIAHQQ